MTKKIHFKSLHGLRAISILFVLFHHLVIQDIFVRQVAKSKIPTYLLRFLSDGQLGVTVFFVISGFLITSLMLVEEEENGELSLKGFYLRRSFRIFPAYLFLLMFYFFISKLGWIAISTTSWITSITYTKYITILEDWYTSHFWSLSIEENFYLVWPLLFKIFKNQRKRIVLLLLFIPLTIRLLQTLHEVSIFNNYHPFCRMDAIAIGCYLALNKPFFEKTNINYPWILLLISVITVFCSSAFTIESGNLFMDAFLTGFAGSFGLFPILGIAYSIYYLVNLDFSWISLLLNSKPMVYVGNLSYSLYLWQQFFIDGKKDLIHTFPWSICMTICIAILSYHLIEKPFLEWRKKFV